MKIIEQGFTCSDQEYYLFGFRNRKSQENVPAVCIDKKNRHRFCAMVRNLGQKTIGLWYLKPGELTEELIEYAHKQNYRII